MFRRKIIYLGWQKQGNFGDDLLFAAWAKMLQDELSIKAYLTRRDYVLNCHRFLLQRVSLLGSERLILLGGGTVIGFDSWGQHLKLAKKMYRTSRVVLAGAGAATSDDNFALATQPHNWKVWNETSGIKLFGVRGPLTASCCNQYWQSTEVLGDPALVYSALFPAMQKKLNGGVSSYSGSTCLGGKSQRLWLGVALGADPASRFDISSVVTNINEQLETGKFLGSKIFVLNPADENNADLLKRRLNGESKVIKYQDDVHETMGEISSCSLFISERLHGCVAAVALGIPTVMLAYASKSVDFWESIATEVGQQQRVSPNSDPIDLAQRIQLAIAAAFSPVSQREINLNVQRLQNNILLAAGQINGWIKGKKDVV